jgi:cathepsin D
LKYSFINNTRRDQLEPGGQFTMGFTNSSLYDGSIEYTSIPGGEGTYWLIPLTSLTINGNAISLPSGDDSYAAIDTGTTLIGGPPNQIAAFFAQIPGSAPATGDWEGYYTYPCSSDVRVTMAFGGRDWAISPADFRVQVIKDNQCISAFFELNSSGSSSPSWIVGDAFLVCISSLLLPP